MAPVGAEAGQIHPRTAPSAAPTLNAVLVGYGQQLSLQLNLRDDPAIADLQGVNGQKQRETCWRKQRCAGRRQLDLSISSSRYATSPHLSSHQLQSSRGGGIVAQVPHTPPRKGG